MSELTPIDASELDVFCSPCDLRKDLHVYARYVQEREVKRLHRNNNLSKSDAMRLAKLMSDPEAAAEVKEDGESRWVDYVDWLALELDFVSYDTEGSYAGYSSSEPTFPDNYILFNARKYQRFLELPLAGQEALLLDTLLQARSGCSSEFFRASILGRLDCFSSWGCGTAVVPTLDFGKIRRSLLGLLQECQTGTWYSVASLVQHLKTAHPFFLIPKKLKYKDGWGRRRRGRYGNFNESAKSWGHEIDIPESASDAFERVEGRYVERFLEGIPLTLGYVDVAYNKQSYKGVYPSLDVLQAFRVTGRLTKGDIPPPKVTIQPNFEIYVESAFYPAAVLSKLAPLTDVVSEDTLTILKLAKKKVAAQLTEDESLNVISLLTHLTGQALPQNVARELVEWVEHSEKFTLYKGFALLEGDEDLAAADPFTVERISPTIRIIRSPTALFTQLEKAEQAPLRVRHPASSLCPLPQKARTVFAIKSQAPKPKPAPKVKEQVTLRRQTTITFHFPTSTLLEKFLKAMLDARCPVKADRPNRTLAFSRRHESQVAAIIQALEKEYHIRVEDVG